MGKAAQYLEDLIGCNSSNGSPSWCAPEIGWVQGVPAMPDQPSSNLRSGDLEFAERQPHAISAGPKRRRAVCRRPAQSEPSAVGEEVALPEDVPHMVTPSMDASYAGAPDAAMEMGAPRGRVAMPAFAKPKGALKRKRVTMSMIPDLPEGMQLGCSTCGTYLCEACFASL